MRTLMLGLLIVAGLIAAGCNTVQGVGKDVEATGEALQDVAE